MYQGPGGMVNRDEYLLGRPIDKYVFEKMEEKEAGCSYAQFTEGSVLWKNGWCEIFWFIYWCL